MFARKRLLTAAVLAIGGTAMAQSTSAPTRTPSSQPPTSAGVDLPPPTPELPTAGIEIPATIPTTASLVESTTSPASLPAFPTSSLATGSPAANEIGNVLYKMLLEHMYKHNLQDWEEAITYYLATGKIKQDQRCQSNRNFFCKI